MALIPAYRIHLDDVRVAETGGQSSLAFKLSEPCRFLRAFTIEDF